MRRAVLGISFVAGAAEIYLPVSRRILPDASFNA